MGQRTGTPAIRPTLAGRAIRPDGQGSIEVKSLDRNPCCRSACGERAARMDSKRESGHGLSGLPFPVLPSRSFRRWLFLARMSKVRSTAPSCAAGLLARQDRHEPATRSSRVPPTPRRGLSRGAGMGARTKDRQVVRPNSTRDSGRSAGRPTRRGSQCRGQWLCYDLTERYGDRVPDLLHAPAP